MCWITGIRDSGSGKNIPDPGVKIIRSRIRILEYLLNCGLTKFFDLVPQTQMNSDTKHRFNVKILCTGTWVIYIYIYNTVLIKLKKPYTEQDMPDNLMAAWAAALQWPAEPDCCNPHCHTSARPSSYTRQEKEIFTLLKY